MNYETERVYSMCLLLRAGVSVVEMENLGYGEAKAIITFQSALLEAEQERWKSLFKMLKALGNRG